MTVRGCCGMADRDDIAFAHLARGLGRLAVDLDAALGDLLGGQRASCGNAPPTATCPGARGYSCRRRSSQLIVRQRHAHRGIEPATRPPLTRSSSAMLPRACARSRRRSPGPGPSRRRSPAAKGWNRCSRASSGRGRGRCRRWSARPRPSLTKPHRQRAAFAAMPDGVVQQVARQLAQRPLVRAPAPARWRSRSRAGARQ